MSDGGGSDEYKVEQILASHVGDNGLEYLIKWKGYSDKHNSWEPASNIIKGARREENQFLGVTEAAEDGNRYLARCLDFISDALEENPDLIFTLETPATGKMKDHPYIAKLEASKRNGGLGATRCEFNFCWFLDSSNADLFNRDGNPFLKPTLFWTNSLYLIHELGTSKAPRFKCSQQSPCPCFEFHRPVQGNCQAATPFPERLCDIIARCVSREAAPRRFRPL